MSLWQKGLVLFPLLAAIFAGMAAFSPTAQADNYVMPPHPDPDGTSLRFGVNRQGDDANKQTGLSVRYFPSQFWVVSTTPRFSFDLETRASGTIAPTNLGWEVYQLSDGSPMDGLGRDAGGNVGGIKRRGGQPIYTDLSGSKGPIIAGTYSGPVEGTGNEAIKFKSTAYRNYDGLYVFLVKGIHRFGASSPGDRNHGYVTGFGGLLNKLDPRTACPVVEDGNALTCPNEDSIGILRQSFYISNSETNPGGHPQYIGTAPANISTTFRWRSNAGGDDYDYEDVYALTHGFATAHAPGPCNETYGGNSYTGDFCSAESIHNHENNTYRVHDGHEIWEYHGDENKPIESHGAEHDDAHGHGTLGNGDEQHGAHNPPNQPAHGQHTHVEPAEHDGGVHGDLSGDNPHWVLQQVDVNGNQRYRWHMNGHWVKTDTHPSHKHPPSFGDHHNNHPANEHRVVSNVPGNLLDNTDRDDGNWHPNHNGPANGGFDVKFTTAGVPCRQDTWSSTDDARKDPGGGYVGNADWDFNRGPGGLDDPGSKSFEGKSTYDDDNISAKVFIPNVTDRTIARNQNESELSDTWTDSIWNIALFNDSAQQAALTQNENTQGNLRIKGWSSQQIHQGGVTFTTGAWPSCQRAAEINLLTPLAPPMMYNGRDSTTLVPQGVDSRLTFAFNYKLGNVPHGYSKWAVSVGDPATGAEIAGTARTGTIGSSNDSSHVAATDIPVPMLASNKVYEWRACATSSGNPSPPAYQLSGGDENWYCKKTQFQVNHGPRATVLNTEPDGRGGQQIKNCYACAVRLDDPEGDRVQPRLTFAWQGSDGANYRVTNGDRFTNGASTANVSGSQYTTTELRIDQNGYTRNGVPQSISNPSQSVADFLRDKVPAGKTVSFVARGNDLYRSSDLPATKWPLAQTPRSAAPQDGWQTFFSGDQVGFKHGPGTTVTILSSGTFDQQPASRKEYLNPNTGQPFNTAGAVSDGQEVDIKLTLTNSGQTAMKRFAVIDYLGSVRDFEPPQGSGPDTARVRVQQGATIRDHNVSLRKVRVVDPNDPSRDEDRAGVANGTREASEATYKLDLKTNADGILPAGELDPGESFSVTYRVRANRNQGVAEQDRTNLAISDFRASLDFGDVHTYARFQPEYCNASSDEIQVINFAPAKTVAPQLRTERGSVHSNSDIYGYGGDNNATYTVTAGGTIEKFSGRDSLSGYDSSQRAQSGACTNVPAGTSGGIDWRRTMTTNITALVSGPTNGSDPNSNILNPGNGSGKAGQLNGNGSSNVFVIGSPTNPTTLDLNQAIRWSGVGTLVVFGNLTINANTTYANSQSSVGIIVVGNLTFGPNVASAVGSYYVSDVNFAANPLINPTTNCPTIIGTNGAVTTSNSPVTLKVDGLFVARSFNFGRYYANPATATGPAEQVYYDGRVLSLTPPGFTTFARNTSWYEITPGQ